MIIINSIAITGPKTKKYRDYKGTTFQLALVMIRTRLAIWIRQEINPTIQRPTYYTYFEVSDEDQRTMIQNETYPSILQSKRLARRIMYHFNVTWMNMKRKLELNELLLESAILFSRSGIYARTFQNLV